MIGVPAKPINLAHRTAILELIKGISYQGGTPTAQAYAEAGAYMMGTTTYTDRYYSPLSGFYLASRNSGIRNNSHYISPVGNDECSGYGIYLLTDGEPNTSQDSYARKVMNKSLNIGYRESIDCRSGLWSNGRYGRNAAWGCMGAYAKQLNNKTNPSGQVIKTATVGFGATFAGIPKDADGNYNCNGISTRYSSNRDARNLCLLGNKGAGYGEGGFYYTQSAEDIAKSVVDFANGLGSNQIDPVPSGTIAVPEDPLKAGNLLPFAYLPMLEARVGDRDTIWPGNLKKYHTNQGTLYGNNKNASGKLDTPLFTSESGSLSSIARDIWQAGNSTTGNNAVNMGGVYAKLAAPNATTPASVRNVYVEDVTSSNAVTLRKVGVDVDGKPSGFNTLVDCIYNRTTSDQTINGNTCKAATGSVPTGNKVKRYLLNFLGYNIAINDDALPTTALAVPSDEVRVLGGVVHSKPALVTYSVELTNQGKIAKKADGSPKRTDYLVFGSMDGAVHMVDAASGAETFAILPKKLINQQLDALKPNATTAEQQGKPVFGVDAPWHSQISYKPNLTSTPKTIEVNRDASVEIQAMLYGGLGRGGTGIYAVNVANANAPELKFVLDNTSSGLSNMGQILSKPTFAKIRVQDGTKTKARNVLIFGGGYDTCYEDDGFQLNSLTNAINTCRATSTTRGGTTVITPYSVKGKAVYMVDAATGELIWSVSDATTAGKNVQNTNMKHSVVGGITVLDRNNDGFMDHLYFADLGGQVFRADFANAEKTGNGRVVDFRNVRVERLLNTQDDTTTLGTVPFRFYAKPMVSFYRNQRSGRLFAMVNVASGDRSSPLSTIRDTIDKADRLYAIMDTDITKRDILDTSVTLNISNLTSGHLQSLPTSDSLNRNGREAIITGLQTGTNRGWYYPLIYFDGFKDVKYTKAVGDYLVTNSNLFIAVYNPNMTYNDTITGCSASIRGGTEQQMYCMPYGVCMELKNQNSTTGGGNAVSTGVASDFQSRNGIGGFTRSGKGIQEIALAAYDAKNTNIQSLLGTTTFEHRVSPANRFKFTSANTDADKGTSIGTGDDGGATDTVNNASGGTPKDGLGSMMNPFKTVFWQMTPRDWYEKTPKN